MSGFNKTIPSLISEYEIYEANSGDELAKVASASDIDLPEGFVFDPDCLYLWVRIVSAGEYYGPNKNGDYFPEAELLKYYETFRNAHTFKNHENKKVENAIGQVLSVRWNPIMKGVEVFKSIDKKIAPEVARGFIKGYLTDVSMGCKVPYTICSICGNKARKQSEFCLHVNRYRMQYLGNGERVFEINYEPNFHDSSTVLTGAERVAKAFVIIDTPPEGVKVAFQKVASDRPGVARYVKLTEGEMNKVASHKAVFHPLLQAPVMNKTAAPDFLSKLAELEKEVSGKLLNIVSDPGADRVDAATKMMDIIKFLTEKRMDPATVSSLGKTLRSLAQSENLPVQRVFTIFLGVAELMGIELYPSELHGILSEITDAKLNDELSLSPASSDELSPTEYTQGIEHTLSATEQLPQFDSPSSLVDLYDEGAHQTDALNSDPFQFMQAMMNDDGMEDRPPVKVVRIIRQTLSPLMSVRSILPEHFLPRLAPILAGFHPVIGDQTARQDFDVLAHPKTLGDMLATFAFHNYQNMRPAIVRTKMIRLAAEQDRELEKVAGLFSDVSEVPQHLGPEGIKRRHLLLFGVPAIYGASAFQRSRREHDRNLSDAENFIADRPGLISGGLLLGGKPLSRAVAKGGVAIAQQGKKVGQGVRNVMEKASTALEFEQMVKIADAFPAGNFNALDENTMADFAGESGLSPEETAALKVATVLAVSNMEKEAQEILDFYELPRHAMGMFLQKAAAVARDELDKAANDFANNLLLDAMIVPHAMAGTLPGRVVDAMLISKMTKKMNDAAARTEQPNIPNATVNSGKDDQHGIQ